MKEILKAFFKNFEGEHQVLLDDVREWFFNYHNYELSNINPYYFFLQNLKSFIKPAPNRRAKIILWEKVKKKKLI